MANVLSLASLRSPSDEFVEALNGFVVGLVRLEFVRRALAAVVASDRQSAATLQRLINEAYRDGRLGIEDYEILAGDLARHLGEDPPTDWSDEAANTADGPAAPVPVPAGAPAPARTALAPGAVVGGRYVLQARLQAGGMTEVYKALDRRHEEAGGETPWLAIKLAGAAHRRDAGALRLLEREAALARELAHPHIVRVHDFARDGQLAFITMEWLDGETLADLLTRQQYHPLAVPHARRIMGEIGSALAFAHARGIVHADVKPGNIFLAREGIAKLLDFGIARSANDAVSQAVPAARTPAYASCEVLEGRPATPRDDVYSLACVAYRMLAGRRVFGHHDALAAETAGQGPAPIRGLSEAQWAALERALAFRRDWRTADIATFLDEFDSTALPARFARFGDDAAVSASSRTRTLWAALVVIVMGTAVALWRWPTTDTAEPLAARNVVPAAEPEAVAEPASTEEAPPEPAVSSDAPPSSVSMPTEGAVPSVRTSPHEAPVKAAVASTTEPEPAPPRREDVTTAAESVRSEPVPAARETIAQEPALPPPAVPVRIPEPAAPVVAAAVPASSTPAPERVAPHGALASTPTAPALVPLSTLKFKRYIEPVDPRHPVEVPGWVELSFTVDADGRTRDIRVMGANAEDRYVDFALAAVKRWRFEPARDNGRAVERHTSVRLRFEPQ